jgi:hypothetical protein
MDEALKNRPTNPHQYPAKRVSFGPRQVPREAEKTVQPPPAPPATPMPPKPDSPASGQERAPRE